jgi:DNA-dependent RNA polymerase auxiliary subunit epsilon
MNYFISFIIGIVAGWIAYRIALYIKLQSMLNSIANAPVPEKKIVNINFVKMDHAVLAYNRETQQFLAQGNTKGEIIALLVRRFPDTSFMANKQNLEEVGL